MSLYVKAIQFKFSTGQTQKHHSKQVITWNNKLQFLISSLTRKFSKNQWIYAYMLILLDKLKSHKPNFIWPERPFSIRMSQRLESICRNLWLWKLSILSAGILSITNFGTEKLGCSWEPNFFFYFFNPMWSQLMKVFHTYTDLEKLWDMLRKWLNQLEIVSSKIIDFTFIEHFSALS